MNQNLFAVLALLLSSTVVLYVAAQSPPSPTDPYQYANFNASTAIIIVVLIGALFFMGFFSIYIRHCTVARNGGTVRPVAAGGQPAGRNRGLDSVVLDTFPTFAYSAVKGLKIGKGALECAVCLNEFEDEDTLRLLPKCDHVFHPECIDAWLSSHTTCPVCRADLAIVADETPVTAGVAPTIPPIEFNDDDDDDSNEPNHQSNTNEPLQNSVSIRVSDNQNGDNQRPQISEPVPIVNPINQNRVVKSRSIKSVFLSKFPRSHSTGHSLIQPGENVDRFTLRLPQDVRKQIMSQRLNRTTSLLILPRETSSRRGYRTGGGEGSGRGKSYRRLESIDQVGKSDRWVFSMVPPFLSKAPSVRSPKLANEGGEGTSSMAARGFVTSLKKSFSRLSSSKVTEPGSVATDSTRPPV